MPHLTVVLQSDPPEVGRTAELADWPLHVTVLQAFRVEARVEEVVQLVNQVLEAVDPMVVTGMASERFGANADVEVTVLRHSRRVSALHRDLLRDLGALTDFRLDEPAYSGDGFRAHVTACRAGALPVGATMDLAWGAIVDMSRVPMVVASSRLTAAHRGRL